jgi:hypothetical protein
MRRKVDAACINQWKEKLAKIYSLKNTDEENTQEATTE